MFFHRGENTEIALESLSVVVADVIFNHLHQALTVSKFSAVVSFTLEDSPEPFHRAIVYAVGNTGHALSHAGSFQLRVKNSVRILKTAVTVKDWVSIGIGLNSSVKSVVNKRIVIAVADHIGNDPSVIKIKDCTEIDLALLSVLIPFEFCYIRQPFLVWSVCMEIPVKNVLSQKLRILSIPGTATVCVLYGRFNIPAAADSHGSFVADVNVVVSVQVIPNPAVAFVRAFHMNLFGKICNLLVFLLPVSLFPGKPSVVCASGYMMDAAAVFYRIPVFLMAVSYGCVQVALPYL